MKSHDMNIDPRHVMLLGDVMSYKASLLSVLTMIYSVSLTPNFLLPG